MTETKVLNYAKGTTIWVQDSRNDGHFLVLQSGRIKIQSEITFHDKRLNRYQAGDTFGIVSALTRNTHRSTLIAEEDCVVISVPISMLGAYVRNHRDIAIKIISLYSGQLSALDDHLTKKDKGQAQANPVRMFEDAKTYHRLNQERLACHAMARFAEWAERNGSNREAVQAARSYLNKFCSGMPTESPDPNNKYLLLKSGDAVFVENEPSDFFYVIRSGTVKISKLVNGSEFILAVLNDGEIFGEMAVLNQNVRNATAVVFQDTQLMRLTAVNFLDDVGEHILLRIFESFSRRIWYWYQRVRILNSFDPVARLYGMLMIAVSDYDARNHVEGQEKYSFNFSLDELKKMIGMPHLEDESIREFLLDNNIRIAGRMLTIESREKIEEKATKYRSALIKERKNILV